LTGKEKRERRVIGLLSGTSMDGIDAGFVALRGAGANVRLRLVAFRTFPFRRADRERLADLAGPGVKDAESLARADVRLGELFARAAERIAAPHGGLERVNLIGSHGQTLLHRPAKREGATVQIGSGPTIAHRTGVPTVYDFRAADVAAGGEGAPLLPITDWLLFRSRRVDRVLLNIGGIANVTILPAGAPWDQVIAYDTGPGNALIDRVVSMATVGKERFDRGGRRARRGEPIASILASLDSHPFLRRRPPKSTGTSTFGDDLAGSLRSQAARLGGSDDDLVATVTTFTATSAAREIRRNTGNDCEVYLCGGGAKNRTLAGSIAAAVAPRPVCSIDALGIDGDAREAVGFALLADEFIGGRRYPMARVTGAAGAAPLGVLAPGDRPYRIRFDRKDRR